MGLAHSAAAVSLSLSLLDNAPIYLATTYSISLQSVIQPDQHMLHADSGGGLRC